MRYVIKRDGTKEKFNSSKIEKAIKKAYAACEKEPNDELISAITEVLLEIEEESYKIETIQDVIEASLMEHDAAIGKRYVLYRNERARMRGLVKTFNEIVEIEDTDVKNENANVNGNTPAGQMMKFASTGSKMYAEDHLISKRFIELQLQNLAHIHDEDYYPSKTTTCVQHDLSKLFKEGFKTGHGFIKEPNRLSTAIDLAAISLQTNQNEQHGGQAIVCWDNALVPYAKKTFREQFLKAYVDHYESVDLPDDEEDYDAYVTLLEQYAPKLERQFGVIELDNEPLAKHYVRTFKIAKRETIRESDQAAQGFIYNMNTMHSRGGGQVVFSSVNTGTDFSPEGRIINKSLLKALYKGLGKGETSIFPIVIWKVKEEINWSDADFTKAIKNPLAALNGSMKFDTPNFDLFVYACHVAAKRLFPTFMFLDTPFNKHEKWNIDDPSRFIYEGSTMGCRTRVFEDLHGEKTAWSRGNLSFTTINLVGLALEAKDIYPNEDQEISRICHFNRRLDEISTLVGEQLHERFEFQCTAKAIQFPFLMGEGLWTGGENLKPYDEVKEVLKHGTLGIGYIGLAEALTCLIGEHHGESNRAQKMGLDIVETLKIKADFFKDKYQLNYACLATPAEGTAGKFTLKDRKKYGPIPGVTDRDFYTNSNHIPVYHNITAFEKISKEAPYHALTGGGHILYIEMDTDAQKNLGAFMMIIKQMKDTNTGYGAINVPSCRCLKCGYDKVFEDKCPSCGEEDLIAIIKRITGYLVGETSRWNSGKKAEEKARVKHGIQEIKEM